MSGYIGPKSADVPVGTISTKGTISGNNIVIGGATVNSTVFTGTANNSTYAFGKTEGDLSVNSAVYANGSATNTFTIGTTNYFVANGNVGIGTSTPAYKLQVSNGSFGITGTANSNISFVEAAATFNSGYVASYINPSMSAVANSDYLFAQSIYPSFNPNGVNTPSLMGIYNNPKIANSSSANGMSLINNYNICSRDSDNDSVTGSIFLYGSLNTVGHNNSSNTSKSYTSTSAYGIFNNLTNMNGSISTIYGTSNIIRIATAANRTANATTAYGFYTTAAVGSASGTGTGAVTNYYDAYLAGVTVNATGTVTNKYGIYQVKTDHINYFGGNTGIGYTSPLSRLHVANEIRVGKTDSSQEGGEIKLCRSSDDAAQYSIDVFGSGSSPALRMFDTIGGTVFLNASPAGMNYIKFNPTQQAVGDSNALDDYEEGTWTPVAASSAGSLTSYTSAGKYIKVGAQVWVSCRITLTNVGTASGSMSLSGFPFTSGTGHQTPTLVREEASTGLMYQAFIFTGQTAGNILNRDNGGIVWTNNYVYVFQLTYTV